MPRKIRGQHLLRRVELADLLPGEDFDARLFHRFDELGIGKHLPVGVADFAAAGDGLEFGVVKSKDAGAEKRFGFDWHDWLP